MISTITIGTTPTKILECQRDHYAVINLSLTNKSDTTTYVDLYIVPNGKKPPTYNQETGELQSGDESTIYVKNVKLLPNQSLLLNTEKFLLSPNDAIYAKASGDDQVTCVVVYEIY